MNLGKSSLGCCLSPQIKTGPSSIHQCHRPGDVKWHPFQGLLASHAGVFRGSRFSSRRDKKRAQLETPAWEAKGLPEVVKTAECCFNSHKLVA